MTRSKMADCVLYASPMSLVIGLLVGLGCPQPEADRSPCSADAQCESGLCDVSGFCSDRCRSAYDCVQGEQCRAGVCRLPCDQQPELCHASQELYGKPSTCEFYCDEYQPDGIACAHGMDLCIAAGDESGGSE